MLVPPLELVCEPELSVVAFRRAGWRGGDCRRWCRALLDAGTAFVMPSSAGGEPLVRLCIVNPRTTLDDVRLVLDSLA